MKSLKPKFILSLFVFFISGLALFAQQIPNEIVTSFQKGNDAVLAGFFNENIDLTVETKTDVYSKSQAQQIVAEFFKANKPRQFTIVHQGGKDDARYAIGSLTTNTGTFRVYFLLKSKDKDVYIHQLRIEKQG